MGACRTVTFASNAAQATKVIFGVFRNGFPRVTLTVSGLSGPVEIEFIIDTGFDGELALPEGITNQLVTGVMEARVIELAGGFRQRCYAYELPIIWNEEDRLVEVLTLDGNPLLGTSLWEGLSLYIENRDNGEVTFETD